MLLKSAFVKAREFRKIEFLISVVSRERYVKFSLGRRPR